MEKAPVKKGEKYAGIKQQKKTGRKETGRNMSEVKNPKENISAEQKKDKDDGSEKISCEKVNSEKASCDQIICEKAISEKLMGERPCRVLEQGKGGPVIFIGTEDPASGDGRDAELPRHLLEKILPLLDASQEPYSSRKPAFTLVFFPVEDWNRDFSPWKAPAVFGDQLFGGKGPKVLDWLLKEGMPAFEDKACDGRTFDCGTSESRRPFYLAGYSLAGLFALWAVYETDAFAGCACCSGSLWFPGWEEYMSGENHPGEILPAAGVLSEAAGQKPVDNISHEPCRRVRREGSLVYLSLGGKEERTKNPVMAQIGNCTRRQEKLLREDPHVSRTKLEWNSGGHFADSGERLAKGIAWLLNNGKRADSTD